MRCRRSRRTMLYTKALDNPVDKPVANTAMTRHDWVASACSKFGQVLQSCSARATEGHFGRKPADRNDTCRKHGGTTSGVAAAPFWRIRLATGCIQVVGVVLIRA